MILVMTFYHQSYYTFLSKIYRFQSSDISITPSGHAIVVMVVN